MKRLVGVCLLLIVSGLLSCLPEEHSEWAATAHASSWGSGSAAESAWQWNGKNLYTDAGSVGIGTADPKTMLHVNGDATVQGNTVLNGPISFFGNTIQAPDEIHMKVGKDWNVTADQNIFFKISKAIGIGADAIEMKAGKVHIKGPVVIEGEVMIKGELIVKPNLAPISASSPAGDIDELQSEIAEVRAENAELRGRLERLERGFQPRARR